MPEKTYKSLPVSDKTHERVTKLGNKGETYDQIIERLLAESPYLNDVRALTDKTYEAFEDSKRTGVIADVHTLLTSLLTALKRFIADVEER